MTAHFKTAVGSCFGEWIVTSRSREGYVFCKCKCGTEKEVSISNLTSGKTKSCGCGKRLRQSEAKKTHGMSGTPTYSSWSSMMTRCYNSNSKNYQRYGARGITVCEEWKTFEGFFASMGEKPEKFMSIERIDNSGNYEPGNCRWANYVDQSRNTRRTKLNEDQVISLRDGSVTKEEIQNITGCADSTIFMAKSGRNWKSSPWQR